MVTTVSPMCMSAESVRVSRWYIWYVSVHCTQYQYCQSIVDDGGNYLHPWYNWSGREIACLHELFRNQATEYLAYLTRILNHGVSATEKSLTQTRSTTSTPEMHKVHHVLTSTATDTQFRQQKRSQPFYTRQKWRHRQYTSDGKNPPIIHR